MRKQHLQLRALSLMLSLGTASAVVYAGDAPAGATAVKGKPAPSDARHEHGEHGGHGKPGADKPVPDKPGLDRAALGKPEPRADSPSKDLAKGAEQKPGRGPGPIRKRELWAELKSGKLKKEELKGRLDELREQREERAKEHRGALQARFGATLDSPAALAELEHHARRAAKLNRAMELVETEAIKDKDKLKARIQKLMEKENARHEQAMARFKTSTPPGASAATPAASGAPPAALPSQKEAQQ